MNLALFFQVTAVFLAVFVVQLLIYGFHELTEANLFPDSEALHWATEPYGPDGIYGQDLSYSLVLLPMGWLTVSALMGRKPVGSTRRRQRASDVIIYEGGSENGGRYQHERAGPKQPPLDTPTDRSDLPYPPDPSVSRRRRTSG